MDNPVDGEVNIAQCQIESEIVGYLLAEKVIKKQADAVPEGIGGYHTLPLQSLNKVATAAYLAYQKTKK